VREMGEKIVPLCAEFIEPVTVCDCCCGSGAMLLAAAEQFDPWMLDWGLVQFYGQDIDLRCTKMARINMMIYGLNGYGIKCALALSGAELAAIPELWREKYIEAQQAEQAGDSERVAEIAVEVGSWKQSVLF